MEQKWLRLDGGVVTVEAIVQPFPNPDQLQLQVVAKDVTQRRQVEDAIRASEERLRIFVAGVKGYGIYLLDAQGRVFTWNSGAEEIKGYRGEEIIGSHFSRFYTKDDLARGWPEHNLKLAVEAGSFEEEGWRVRKDGSCFWAGILITALRNESGDLRGFSKITRDLSEQKRAADALQQSENRFRQLADTIPQLTWMARPDGHIYWYNQRWYDYTGTTLGQMDGWGWMSVHDQDLLPDVLARWRASIATGATFDMVIRLRGADGLFRPFLTRCMALRNSEGQIVQWFGTNTDISEYIKMEEDLRRTQVELEDRVRERTAAAETRAGALARSEAALREQSQLMQAILDSMGEGVVVADVDGRFLLFNPAAEAILGVGPTDASSDKWSDVYGIFRPDTVTHFPSGELPLAKAIRGEATDDCQMFVRNAHVPGWHITVTGRPMLNEQGTVRGGVAVFRDITARKQAEVGLKQAKDIAESANRAKSEFLAHMSHEIRTPMNGVIGMTDLVLDTDVTTGQRDSLNSVKQSADALLAVINDILDFSKIEAGMMDLDSVPFRLRDSLGDMLKPLALRAHNKGLELAYDVLADVPDALHGDKGRLRQIIVNLVGNAIKFTKQGKIVIGVEAQDRTDKELGLHVWVRDTGIGIANEKQSAIFAPFEQADNSTAHRYGGTGLGLTISARLVEMMGGRTWLQSAVGLGSTFHFTVRLRLQDGDESPQPLPEANGKSTHLTLRPLRILLADDSIINQKVAMGSLEKAGHTVVLADNGIDAVNALETDLFDLVLMDVQMPEMDGLEATVAIRQREIGTGRHVPIIALTAHAMKGDRERFLATGMDDYVSKPIDKQELWTAIARCVPPSVVGSLPAPQGNALPDGPGDPTWDRAALLTRIDGNAELLTEILRLFRSEYPRLLTEIQQALSSQNAGQIRRSSHALKGVLGNLSASDALAATLRVEELGCGSDTAGVDDAIAFLQQQMQRLDQAVAQFLTDQSA